MSTNTRSPITRSANLRTPRALAVSGPTSSRRRAPSAAARRSPAHRPFAGGPATAPATADRHRIAVAVPPAVAVRRRRALVAAFVAVVALLLVAGYGIAGADTSGPSSIRTSTSGGVGTGSPSDGGLGGVRVHVVRPGDTLWSIAREAQPNGDIRPLVERLARQSGSRLDVGMRVALPG